MAFWAIYFRMIKINQLKSLTPQLAPMNKSCLKLVCRPNPLPFEIMIKAETKGDTSRTVAPINSKSFYQIWVNEMTLKQLPTISIAMPSSRREIPCNPPTEHQQDWFSRTISSHLVHHSKIETSLVHVNNRIRWIRIVKSLINTLTKWISIRARLPEIKIMSYQKSYPPFNINKPISNYFNHRTIGIKLKCFRINWIILRGPYKWSEQGRNGNKSRLKRVRGIPCPRHFLILVIKMALTIS